MVIKETLAASSSSSARADSEQKAILKGHLERVQGGRAHVM